MARASTSGAPAIPAAFLTCLLALPFVARATQANEAPLENKVSDSTVMNPERMGFGWGFLGGVKIGIPSTSDSRWYGGLSTQYLFTQSRGIFLNYVDGQAVRTGDTYSMRSAFILGYFGRIYHAYDPRERDKEAESPMHMKRSPYPSATDIGFGVSKIAAMKGVSSTDQFGVFAVVALTGFADGIGVIPLAADGPIGPKIDGGTEASIRLTVGSNIFSDINKAVRVGIEFALMYY